MRRKNQKPPICIGGSEKLRAMDRPRYMNVPLPAPCHVNVAGVGKQSVWGLRIIAKTQLSLWHHSVNSSIAKTSINSVVTWLVAAVFNSCIDAQLTPAIGR